MAEYIDKEVLKNDIATSTEPFNTGSVFRAINRQIAADVAPVVHAHWTGSNRTYCSHCERSYMDVADADSWESSDIPDFCPYCGAQMDEKEG